MRIQLFGKILLLTHQFAECRIFGRGSRARRRQRLLDGMTANSVSEAKRFRADVGNQTRISREHDEVGFHDNLQSKAARCNRRRIVVVGVLLRGRHHARYGCLEFADRLGIASRLHQSNGQRAARGCGVEMSFAHSTHLALHQLLRRRDARINLARGIKRKNPRWI